MKTQHSPRHWIAVALTLAMLLLTFGEARGEQAAAPADKTWRKDVVPQRDKGVAPKRDKGVAKEQRSATKKVTRAAKSTIKRARHGVAVPES